MLSGIDPPIRLAFVGQSEYFAACALEGPVPGIEPRFFPYREGEDFGEPLHGLVAWGAECVVVFRPELVPAGALGGLDAVTVGFVTEPVPRGAGDDHPDLLRRLETLARLDPSGFDRIVSYDPLIVDAVERFASVWRSLPLPVADCFFGPVAGGDGRPISLFVGRSTEHRERFLTPIKHEFDTLHVAHGASGRRLEGLLREATIGINLHNESYPTFESRVGLYLAAGLLCVSEPLSPTHGLEPGIDYVEVHDPVELHEAIYTATHYPQFHRRIRVRGRMKAERFRASAVWPRLVFDLAADLRAHGRGRVTGLSAV
jgi:hypothetical protein